ncbi:MAG: ribosomal L7Ae/L30e/S12e/Gadd45 family protein [Clostridiales bacterium]|nr:ribosomal L7Ae/L30e/S12e/Gadd45 family protein [Clostridiales bacterium]
MQTRLHNAIGLCQKAGKCVSGATAVELALKGGKALLVLLEDRASVQTIDGYRAMCETRQIGFHLVETVGEAIGKPSRIVMAITDRNFQKMIEDAMASDPRV